MTGTPVTPFTATIAEIIKGLRHLKGVTLATVVERTGLSKSTVIRIEKGTHDIPIDWLVLIADALSTTASEVVREAERRLNM